MVAQPDRKLTNRPAPLGASWITARGLSFLLACDIRCVFSNTNWSCLQMPSKSQNSPNLLNFVNSIQPTPVTIAACLHASLELCEGTIVRGARSEAGRANVIIPACCTNKGCYLFSWLLEHFICIGSDSFAAFLSFLSWLSTLWGLIVPVKCGPFGMVLQSWRTGAGMWITSDCLSFACGWAVEDVCLRASFLLTHSGMSSVPRVLWEVWQFRGCLPLSPQAPLAPLFT